MARKLRIQYPGAIYHVMNRGDRREAIFADDADRQRFLETLTETCQKTGWQVHAYCLMSNHFHLVVETPQATLVAGMKWLLGTYTGRFNRRHKQFGHLFSGRYKALIVDGSGSGYLKTACDYVASEPRARQTTVKADQPLAGLPFPWSSYPAYLSAQARRPAWLRGWIGCSENGASRHGHCGGAGASSSRGWRGGGGIIGRRNSSSLERGWCLGSEGSSGRSCWTR